MSSSPLRKPLLSLPGNHTNIGATTDRVEPVKLDWLLSSDSLVLGLEEDELPVVASAPNSAAPSLEPEQTRSTSFARPAPTTPTKKANLTPSSSRTPQRRSAPTSSQLSLARPQSATPVSAADKQKWDQRRAQERRRREEEDSVLTLLTSIERGNEEHSRMSRTMQACEEDTSALGGCSSSISFVTPQGEGGVPVVASPSPFRPKPVGAVSPVALSSCSPSRKAAGSHPRHNLVSPQRPTRSLTPAELRVAASLHRSISTNRGRSTAEGGGGCYVSVSPLSKTVSPVPAEIPPCTPQIDVARTTIACGTPITMVAASTQVTPQLAQPCPKVLMPRGGKRPRTAASPNELYQLAVEAYSRSRSRPAFLTSQQPAIADEPALQSKSASPAKHAELEAEPIDETPLCKGQQPADEPTLQSKSASPAKDAEEADHEDSIDADSGAVFKQAVSSKMRKAAKKLLQQRKTQAAAGKKSAPPEKPRVAPPSVAQIGKGGKKKKR